MATKKAKRPSTKKTAAKPRNTKAKKPDRKAAAKAAIGHNSADPATRELFLQNKSEVDRLRDQAQKANGKYRAALKKAKGDGFPAYMFDVARQLETPEGEAEYIGKLDRQVQAAQFVGSTKVAQIAQLDLFEGIDRTDATERAYDEGQKASMENKAAKPPYAPGTAQHEAFLKGHADHQAKIAKGFKSTDKGAKPAAEKERATRPPRASETAKEPEPGPSEPGPAPVGSGEMITRAELLRRQAAQQISAANGQQPPQESQFQRRAAE